MRGFTDDIENKLKYAHELIGASKKLGYDSFAAPSNDSARFTTTPATKQTSLTRQASASD